ncbi:F-box/WD repeat-containing protein 4-like isoform X2 [Syngnathus acus]|uniref:F-box/WD repeat-containing protein 4 isoform X2 n=1 Tax=Syngnathus acus TaxID=161584 RepID=UPI001885D208|nr:F-box/WD repeat-containing protein 4 isoform X2 [Syngnathus acus]XP_037126866.1 F-box/WD repeat-containing protein 4-like isoform X2 [Syngnathus acus]
MLLFQLPEDVLYHILSYLDCQTLSRLSQVSKVIWHIVSRDVVWKKIAKGLLNTGITRYWTDIYPHILLKERVKIAQNWCHGVCKRTTPLKWKPKLLPWLQLDGDTLFLSQAGEIQAYPLRQDCKKIWRKPIKIYSGHRADVCRFVLTDTHLISGGSDGKIVVHSRRSESPRKLFGHNQEVNCIDSKNQLIISGSRDQTTKIWTLASSCPRDSIPLYDRVWSVAINPTLRSECMGSLGSEFRRGAGVLDMLFESPFHLFTCGYDTFIRLWDLRLSRRKNVMEWEEPHDSALYCMQTDGNHMIASGSSYYGVVRLWDKRQTQCLQFFQLSSDLVSSPVYCLRFSNSHLYAALATALHSLDFRHNVITIR